MKDSASDTVMSNLPLPLNSITQVIAEEEAAAEQDEKSTQQRSPLNIS